MSGRRVRRDSTTSASNSRTIYGTRNDAATALAAHVTEAGDGHRLLRQDDKQLTLDSLVAWYLEFARQDRGLDHSTLTGYANAYSYWPKEPIGHKRASSITTADIDTAFGRMRRAGLSRTRMNNARALLSGAFKSGQRHRKVTSNPVDGFELPPGTHTPRHTTAPELDELLLLLATAAQHDEMLVPVLKLAASTGLRRGELSAQALDVAAKSWVSMAAFNGPIIGFGCNESHQTSRNIVANGEFVINIPDTRLASTVWDTLATHGAERVARSGLTFRPATVVDVPVVADCVAHLECRHSHTATFDDGEVFIFGTIVAASIDARCITDNATVCYHRLDPLFFLENQLYAPLGRPGTPRAQPAGKAGDA